MIRLALGLLFEWRSCAPVSVHTAHQNPTPLLFLSPNVIVDRGAVAALQSPLAGNGTYGAVLLHVQSKARPTTSVTKVATMTTTKVGMITKVVTVGGQEKLTVVYGEEWNGTNSTNVHKRDWSST